MLVLHLGVKIDRSLDALLSNCTLLSVSDVMQTPHLENRLSQFHREKWVLIIFHQDCFK